LSLQFLGYILLPGVYGSELVSKTKFFISSSNLQMLLSQKTNIPTTGHFHPEDYPDLKLGLAVIDERMANFPILHKADMLIASLKGVAMKESWKKANPAVAALLLSCTLPILELKELFSHSRNAIDFTMELETYIRNWFKVTTPIY
jgi:hypothetical protein